MCCGGNEFRQKHSVATVASLLHDIAQMASVARQTRQLVGYCAALAEVLCTTRRQSLCQPLNLQQHLDADQLGVTTASLMDCC